MGGDDAIDFRRPTLLIDARRALDGLCLNDPAVRLYEPLDLADEDFGAAGR